MKNKPLPPLTPPEIGHGALLYTSSVKKISETESNSTQVQENDVNNTQRDVESKEIKKSSK